ncbi:MAG: hypothetical protein KBS64_05745 [Treponema sp.]|nr:hypothetical protein [Candidatus Treponema equi]
MAKNSTPSTLTKSFLFKLTGRTSLFFALLLIILMTYYISGNYQNFLDSTQRFILFLCSADCIILFLFSIAGIIESVTLYFISLKRHYWIFFAIYILSTAISLAVFIAVRAVSILSLGLN